MSFDIHKVDLVNFRSYIGGHTFEFPTEDGLYNLTGKNLCNSHMGSNGAGKSTLLEAIYWCLYGHTTRGLKAGDVISWERKQCAVTVHSTIGERQIQVRRTQNPNSLTVTEGTLATVVDQEGLQKYLRLGPDAFVYAVMLPQFGESFFDLTPAAKLTLFSQIMELDFWLEKSNKASEKAQGFSNQKAKHEIALAKAEAKVETTNEDVKNLNDKQTDFAGEQAETIKRLEQELRELAKDEKYLEGKRKEIKSILLSAEEKISKLIGRNVCPTCKQKIPNADLAALNQNKEDFTVELNKLLNKQRHNRDRQADLQLRISNEVKRISPYAQMIKEKKHDLAKLKEQVTEEKAAIASLDEKHAAISYWIGGFKRIRLFIIEETLRQLEVEVNNNLTNLGLMDWRVEFDVERENKSGGITKGFVVLIYPPNRDTPVRYEAWSGGETQRLRMAGDFGLANLIMERAGLTGMIEFFDEPSEHLSDEGLLDLAETLYQRAHNGQKRIFLVDHRNLDFGGFTNTIVVTRDASGSHLS